MTTPQVLSTSPVNGSTDVKIDSVIDFVFNTPLDKSSISFATVTVFDPDTLDPISGTVGYIAATNTIRFIPRAAFLEDRSYSAVVIGVGSGAGSWIRSADGDALPDDIRIDFRTVKERYVPLDEVADRTDLELTGPIRAVEAVLPPQLVGIAVRTPDIQILDSSPKGFASEVDPCIDEVTIKVSYPLEVLNPLDSFVIETYPVLGMDEYLGAADGRGLVWLNDGCAPTGDYEYQGPTGIHIAAPPVFMNPTGYFAVSGENVIWTKYPDEPCFMYNQEVHFVIRAGTTGALNGVTGEFGSDSEIVFTTKYVPKYIDSRMLRVELGPMVASLFDDTLNRIIHKNSLDAWEQAAGNFSFDNPYPAVKRYVKYASIIDVIDSISLTNSGGLIMDEDKTLGDFRYRRSGSSKVAMHPKYEQAKKELAKALREIRAYRGQPQAVAAVKGSSHPSSRMDEMRRTWDNWTFWSYEGLVMDGTPGANMYDERISKLYNATDHHGYSRSTYGLTPRGVFRSVFKCRSKDQ